LNTYAIFRNLTGGEVRESYKLLYDSLTLPPVGLQSIAYPTEISTESKSAGLTVFVQHNLRELPIFVGVISLLLFKKRHCIKRFVRTTQAASHN